MDHVMSIMKRMSQRSDAVTVTTLRQRLATVALLAGGFALSCGSAGGAVLMVKPGQSITDTIGAARPGDTVQVATGVYTERLLIDKPITLQGQGRPTINAQGTGDVIRVRAADVTIDGFIIQDSGIDLGAQNAGVFVEPGSHRVKVSNNALAYNLFGVWINDTKDARVINNVITGKRDLLSAARGNGIQLFNTTGAQIIDNNISFARDGIYVDVSSHALFRGNRIHHLRYGTHYMNTHHSTWENNESYLNRGGLALMEVRDLTVRNNRAWGNTDHGIMLRTIQDSVIENNVVAGNGRGFFVYDAEYNTLQKNLIVGNRVGIHLTAGSFNNKVDGNDFIGNQEQIKYVATRDVEWGRSQGNYWSNYGGWDQNGDGVGDVAYEANDLVDRLNWQYPLIKLLLSSPAIQTLRFVARQFPVLRAPSIVDKRPRMAPLHEDWRRWREK